MGYSYVVIGGAGRSGSVIVRDLISPISREVDRVIVVDVNRERAHKLSLELQDQRLEVEICDATDRASLVRVMKKADICINAALYYVNMDVMHASLEARCPYVDLGSFFHPVLEQKKLHNRFVEKGVPAVICAGTSPGATNLMAKYLVDLLDTVESIHIRDGYAFLGSPPPVFVSPYSVVILIEEYIRPCVSYVNGEFVTSPPLSGEEEYHFPDPAGRIKCVCADHEEIATFPESFKHKGLKNVTWKLGLPQEVDSITKALIASGFTSHEPIELKGVSIDPLFIADQVASRNLSRYLEKSGLKAINLYEIIRVVSEGTKDEKKVKYILDMHCPPPKAETGTGEAASVIAQIFARMKDNTEPGVWVPEEVINPMTFIDEMKRRGFMFVLTKEEEL